MGLKATAIVYPKTVPGYVSGRYYGPPIAAVFTTIALAADKIYWVPVYVAKTAAFSGIGCFPTIAVAIGARLGLYKDTGIGAPGTLVAAATAIASLTAAAKNDAAFAASVTLTPGWYWLGIDISSAATFTGIAAGGLAGSILGIGDLVAAAASINVAPTSTHVYAALPATAPAMSYVESATSVYLALKAA